jgi:deazaflavin-dependent oxidoreductase (nitroreductase family)
MLFGQEHVDTYRQTAGQEGYDWQGTTVLILTTKGRRSGEPRDAPLIFAEHDGDYVIVASRGGTPAHPSWYLNLERDPNVEVQIKGERFPARARTATGEERDALWRLMTQSWPAYDDYQQKTDREIPVVVLERA